MPFQFLPATKTPGAVLDNRLSGVIAQNDYVKEASDYRSKDKNKNFSHD